MLGEALREGDFQAAWFYSIIVAAMLCIVVPATVYAIAGVRRVWRSGDHAAAAVIGAAAVFALMFFTALLLLAGIGLLRRAL
ncbi:MAG TPA: hypothetical protein VJU79_05465 [Candidatus Dormibacteraeota bacterium]|nr:hypothetical protein [Candidatus Dormibacteraeota bacterium]